MPWLIAFLEKRVEMAVLGWAASWLLAKVKPKPEDPPPQEKPKE